MVFMEMYTRVIGLLTTNVYVFLWDMQSAWQVIVNRPPLHGNGRGLTVAIAKPFRVKLPINMARGALHILMPARF